MSEKLQGPGNMDTSERMATLAGAMTDGIKHQVKASMRPGTAPTTPWTLAPWRR